MTQKQLRSLSRKGTGAVCRELPLFRKKRDTFCTSERCVESLNNYPFSLYICRMLSSSNGDDDIIPSCRQRIPALSLLFLSSSKKLRKAQEKQSYQRFQHVGHTAFNTSGTNVSCLLSRAKAGTHSAHLKESHTSAHTAKQGLPSLGHSTVLCYQRNYSECRICNPRFRHAFINIHFPVLCAPTISNCSIQKLFQVLSELLK